MANVEQFTAIISAEIRDFKRKMKEVDKAIRDAATGADIDVGANVKDFMRNIKEVREEMKRLSRDDVTVEVQASVNEVLAELNAVEDRLKEIEREDATIDVQANVRDFLRDMRNIESRVRDLNRTEANVQVTASVADAIAEMTRVERKADELLGSNVHVDVEADVDDALRDFETVQNRIRTLSQQEPTIDVEADIRDCMRDLRTAELRIDRLTEQNHNIHIEANITEVIGQLNLVENVAERLEDETHDIEIKADTSDALRRMAELRAEIMNMNRSRPEIEIQADISQFMARMAQLRATIETLRRTNEIHIDAETSSIKYKLAMLRAQIQALTRDAVIEIELRINKFQASISRLASNIRAFSEVAGYMLQGVFVGLIPMIAPIFANIGALIGNLGVMIGVLAGQTMGFAFALGTAFAGFGGVMAMAIGNVTALYEKNAKLNEQQKQTKAAIDDIKKTYDSLVQATQKPILEGVQKGAQVATTLLKQLEPMFIGASTAFNDLMASLKQSIGTPPVQQFIEYLNTSAGPMLTTFGQAIGNLFKGLGSMFVAFAPLSESVSQGFLKMSESFAAWAAGLQKSEKFQSFISYVQENMPKISSIFGDAIVGVVNFFSAFGDSASGMMTSLQGIMERWREWTAALGENQAFQDFLSYVSATAPGVMSLIGNLTTFLVNLGIGMAPLGAKLLEMVNSFLQWANSMMQAHPVIGQIIAVVISLSGAFMAVMPVILMVKSLFSGLGGVFLKIIPFFVSLAGSIIPAFTAVLSALAGPVGIAIAAITLLAGAVYLIITNWSSITAFFSALWESIKTIFTTVVTAIATFLSTTWASIIATAQTVFSALATFFSTIWSGIQAIFTAIWTAITAALVAIWNSLSAAATTAFSAVKTVITNVWNTIKSVTSSVWNGIKSVLTGIWNGLKSAASSVFNSIKSVITTVWNGIKSVTTSVWNAIKSAVTTAVNAIKSIVTSVFNAIKSTVTSVMNAIKSFITNAWNAIKSAVTSAVNGIKSVVTSVFNAIRSTVTSIMNSVKSVITNAWNAAKSVVTSAVNGIKSIVTSVFNALVNVVKSAMTNVLSAIKSGWNAAKSFLSGINLVGIGKNIMQGLVNGIKSMAGAVIGAAKSIADKVTSTIKSALNIHSPSRVTKELGEWTSIGFANGIKDKTKVVTASATKTATAAKTAFNNSLKNLDLRLSAGSISTTAYVKEVKALGQKYKGVTNAVATANAKAVKAQSAASRKSQQDARQQYLADQKNFNNKVTNLDNKYKANKINAAAYSEEMNHLAKTYNHVTNAASKVAAKTASINKQLFSSKMTQISNNYQNGEYTIEKYLKKLEQTKEKYKSVKGAETKVDKEIATVRYELNKQTVDSILADETIGANKQIALIKEIGKEYAKGSQKRQYFDEQVKKSKQELYDNLTALSDAYTTKIQDANDKLVESERKLNEEYEKAFTDRRNSLYNFAGLFDEVKNETAKTSSELIANLQSQVTTMTDWANNINSLASRGIDAALLTELQEMGVKSASEIAALNSMTDEELDEFVALWKEKSSLATNIATGELADLRKSTDAEITKLRTETTAELAKYNEEWQKEIKAITGGTTKQFNAMTSKMRGIGKNVIKGLQKGLSDLTPDLQAQVEEMTAGIKTSIQDAFDINSPSRWANKFIGQNIVKGMINGIASMQAQAVKTANTLAEEVKEGIVSNIVVSDVLGYTATSSSAISEQLAVSVKVQVEGDGSGGVTGSSVVINNQYDNAPSSPSELARQQRKQIRQLGLL